MKKMSIKQIQEDVHELRKNLEEIHPNPYKYISKGKFSTFLELMTKDTHDVKTFGLALMVIISKLQDCHTHLELSDDVLGVENFMFKFKYLNDGYYLTNSSELLSNYFGSELLGINNFSIEELEKKLSIFIPQENEISTQHYLSSIMVEPSILEFVGISKGTNIELHLKQNNEKISVIIPLQSCSNPMLSLKENLPNIAETLLNKEIYWTRRIPSLSAFYFQYNECEKKDNLSINLVTEEFKNSGLDRIVVDLRNNKGGDSDLLNPLVGFLRKHPDQYKKIVLTGSDTYSSAIINLLQLSIIPNTISVGEIPHGNPTHYGEVESFTLTNSRLNVFTSSKIFRSKGYKLGDSFKPTYIVNTKIEDLLKGKDTQIDYLSCYRNKRTGDN